MGKDEPKFKPGDKVIVTTFCEDIALHGLIGTVSLQGKTGTYYVVFDVDKSRLPMREHEIGHYF